MRLRRQWPGLLHPISPSAPMRRGWGQFPSTWSNNGVRPSPGLYPDVIGVGASQASSRKADCHVWPGTYRVAHSRRGFRRCDDALGPPVNLQTGSREMPLLWTSSLRAGVAMSALRMPALSTSAIRSAINFRSWPGSTLRRIGFETNSSRHCRNARFSTMNPSVFSHSRRFFLTPIQIRKLPDV